MDSQNLTPVLVLSLPSSTVNVEFRVREIWALMAPGDPLEVADLTVGMILEAQDDRGVWYRAKVKRVCEERGAKVHYAGYECQTHEKRAPGSAARLQEAWPAETVADELEATGHGSTAVCVGPDEYLRRHTSPAVGSRLSPRRRPAGRRSLLHCWRAGLDYNLYAPPPPQSRTAANALVHRRCAHALAADAHALAATHGARVWIRCHRRRAPLRTSPRRAAATGAATTSHRRCDRRPRRTALAAVALAVDATATGRRAVAARAPNRAAPLPRAEADGLEMLVVARRETSRSPGCRAGLRAGACAAAH